MSSKRHWVTTISYIVAVAILSLHCWFYLEAAEAYAWSLRGGDGYWGSYEYDVYLLLYLMLITVPMLLLHKSQYFRPLIVILLLLLLISDVVQFELKEGISVSGGCLVLYILHLLLIGLSFVFVFLHWIQIIVKKLWLMTRKS